jgi:hypothetical protein
MSSNSSHDRQVHSRFAVTDYFVCREQDTIRRPVFFKKDDG